MVPINFSEMNTMGKKGGFRLGAFLKNTVLGIVFILICSTCVFKYIDTIYTKQNEKESVYTFDEKSKPYDNVITENTKNLQKNNKPVFLHTLSQEELKLQPETDTNYNTDTKKINLTAADIEKLKDFDYIKRNFYIIDNRTELLESDINAEEFLNMDFSIKKDGDSPKILIFHTHSSEMYADSDRSKGIEEGIWGVGEKLKNILEEKYGIAVMHDSGRYDVVDGKTQIIGAYERMEPAITKILQENPSIEIVIDMHRDGVNENVHLTNNINGKTCAKVMFFNGLCRLKENGVLNNISSLPNSYIKDNLALSFNMQVTANKLYPDFTRRIYINAYRYSLNMLPKSMLIEVGAQTNTKSEAQNAMEPLADILSRVILAE